jgi:hypothetical protein
MASEDIQGLKLKQQQQGEYLTRKLEDGRQLLILGARAVQHQIQCELRQCIEELQLRTQEESARRSEKEELCAALAILRDEHMASIARERILGNELRVQNASFERVSEQARQRMAVEVAKVIY